MANRLLVGVLGLLILVPSRVPSFAGTWLLTEPQGVSYPCCFIIEQTDDVLTITQTLGLVINPKVTGVPTQPEQTTGSILKYGLTGIPTQPVAIKGAVQGTYVYTSHWDGAKLVTERRAHISGRPVENDVISRETRYLGPSGEMIVEWLLDTSPEMASSAVGKATRLVYRRKT